MRLFAHVAAGEVTATATAVPDRWEHAGQWVDIDPADPASIAAAGWAEVVVSPRPADTAEVSYEGSVELVDGVPTMVWTAHAKDPAEVAAEVERRARLVLEARVRRLEERLDPPQPDPADPDEAPPWGGYDGVWPNGCLLLEGGKVWRNVAGVPLTFPPSEFPGHHTQWTRLFELVLDPAAGPDPGVEPAWGVGVDVVADVTVVVHAGRRWRAKVSHTTHAGWEPSPAAYAIWDDLGPV